VYCLVFLCILWDLDVGGSYTFFGHIFVKIFQFLYIWFWGCFCIFDWLLIPICLAASLYISSICMIGHLYIVWFSAFYDNSTSHVRCCAYLVHLNINFWCWYVEIWFEDILLGDLTSDFSMKKREKMREKSLNSDNSIWALYKCIAHPNKPLNKGRCLNV